VDRIQQGPEGIDEELERVHRRKSVC
jgi:hypothetical protein